MKRSIYTFREHVTSFRRNLTPLSREIISYVLMGVGAILLILSVICAQKDINSPTLCMISALSLASLLIAFYVSVNALLREG